MMQKALARMSGSNQHVMRLEGQCTRGSRTAAAEDPWHPGVLATKVGYFGVKSTNTPLGGDGHT